MLKIALITNFNIYEKANAAVSVANYLLQKECEVLIASFNRDKLVRMNRHREEFRYLTVDAVYAEADIIIV